MVNLQYLVQCKKVTDFDDSKQKTKKGGLGEDQNLDDDESNDSEFNEDEALKEQAEAGQLWDDEENFIGDKDQGGEEGEEEQNDDAVSIDEDAAKKAVKESQSCSEIDLNEIDGKMLALTSNDGDSDGSIV